MTRQLLAEICLVGMGFDAMGGLYLAYDLLGGQHGPLRTIARATSYIALFLIGYTIVLGPRYAIVAATGMGILLAFEYRLKESETQAVRSSRSRTMLFGFLRGVVLGIAGSAVNGFRFGILFGILSGIALMIVYSFDFAPLNDFETSDKPRVSRHQLMASLLRAIGIAVAGVLSASLTRSASHSIAMGLRLGIAAGAVSALVGLFSPAIELWSSRLPERRLGLIGLGLIVVGMILQSVQYWVVVFNISVR